MILPRRRRPAFRLVDLIVTVIVIVILIGVLLPGMQRGHGDGARTQCTNNLKQVGLAVHNYASAYNNTLPPLTSDVTKSKGDSGRWNGGLFFTLLPFLEQNIVFSHAVERLPECTWYAPIMPNPVLPLTTTPPGTSGGALCSQPLKIYQCPADPTIVNGLSSNQTQTQTAAAPYCFPWAGSSYAANYQVFGTENRFGAPELGNYCGPKYNIGNVPDGNSNTAFFGEQFAACGDSAGNLWAYPGIGNYSGARYSAVPGAQAPAGAGGSIINTPESTNSPLWFPVFANGDPTYGFTAGGLKGSIFRHNSQMPAPAPIQAPYEERTYWDAPPQIAVQRTACDKSRLQSGHAKTVLIGLGDGSVRTVNGEVSQHSWYCAIVPDDGTAFDSSW